LLGRPLIGYTISAALRSTKVDRVIVSSDDPEIQSLSVRLGAESPFLRPAVLATDSAPTLPVIEHALTYLFQSEGYRPSAIVTLQPTSPMRNERHIDQAIDLYLNNNTDSVVSVVQVPHNMTPQSIMLLNRSGYLLPYLDDKNSTTRRQDKALFAARNGAAIYVSSYESIINHGSLFGSTTLPYFMSKIYSVDIDDEEDWFLTESLMKMLSTTESGGRADRG